MSIPATNFINHEGGYRTGKTYTVPIDAGVVQFGQNSTTKHKGILIRNNDPTVATQFDIQFSDGLTVRIAVPGYNVTNLTGNFGAGYILPCVVRSVKSMSGSTITGTVTLLL